MKSIPSGVRANMTNPPAQKIPYPPVGLPTVTEPANPIRYVKGRQNIPSPTTRLWPVDPGKVAGNNP